MGGQARCGARPASLDFKKCLRLMNGLFLRRKVGRFFPRHFHPLVNLLTLKLGQTRSNV
jgi:hypothetical protein